jgi:hypothetical protein
MAALQLGEEIREIHGEALPWFDMHIFATGAGNGALVPKINSKSWNLIHFRQRYSATRHGGLVPWRTGESVKLRWSHAPLRS